MLRPIDERVRYSYTHCILVDFGATVLHFGFCSFEYTHTQPYGMYVYEDGYVQHRQPQQQQQSVLYIGIKTPGIQFEYIYVLSSLPAICVRSFVVHGVSLNILGTEL